MARKRHRPLTVNEFASLGGKARAKKLTRKERQDSARKAAIARWRKTKGSDYRPPE